MSVICHFLDLSTDHLSPETCKKLDQWLNKPFDRSREPGGEVYGGPMPYGWFVCADEAPNPDLVPVDLAACMRHALDQNCTYVLFDANTDPTDALPDLGGPD